MGLWDRLREGLQKTRQSLGDRLRQVIQVHGRQWDDSLFDSLEEVLFEADVGVETVEELLQGLREDVRRNRPPTEEGVLNLLGRRMVAMLGESPDPWRLGGERPEVWLLVGVNGTGKTTTAGKMAFGLQARGARVILGAADTFRAAAVEQLQAWGRRAGVDVVAQGMGADPAAVAFDTVQAARARGADVALIDTAGRLHTKSNLMQELGKVVRVVQRDMPNAPHQSWLVLDATTGQNALAQARTFLEVVPVSGIVLTKLDGTAKGGVALAVRRELGIPVRWVGVGERPEDLMPFDPEAYVAAMLGTGASAGEPV
ncbi:signal recognition particle (docking protein) [Candidatus Hydrogenisulfobacillus filiaventi]|uniref:Signal recognition particle receptor FtsY n=1 Tax=Candidatus Hydrogenisulfobacillus filiaventi TaxID=2707344 RepID=A0A6F8ZHD6_9FIRM|nr:signal recognition particle-docking protein FtsY [Bacillota bacterium]CAB1129089.1 signal recognition particle (docking protein) [Candidatus Hydrogenisulfobacillus filiaventi]